MSELETKYHLPATFVLLFDETWRLALESHRMLLSSVSSTDDDDFSSKDRHCILHPSMKFSFDMLAWHIDPRRQQSGFSPHRDRQPETYQALQDSFYNGTDDDNGGEVTSGMAKYVTHWIALSDATPENSCLYVIPRQFDPGYFEGDDPKGDDVEDETCKGVEETDLTGQNTVKGRDDPLTRALSTKESYQNIRALPRQSGQSLIFTHRILHWGSKGNSNALNVQPRIAISFVYSDEGFEAPYLTRGGYFSGGGDEESGDTSHDKRISTFPPFHIRLLLTCAQLLIYYQRFNLSTSTLRACYDYCKFHSDELNEVYRKKVFVEFVKAMKETRDGGGGAEGGEIGNDDAMVETDGASDDNTGNNHHNVGIVPTANNNEANSDDEEALLEAMLNHHEEFDDDFDEMECKNHEQKRHQGKKRKK